MDWIVAFSFFAERPPAARRQEGWLSEELAIVRSAADVVIVVGQRALKDGG